MKNSTEEVLNNLDNEGVHLFGEIIDKKVLSKLFRKMKDKREFGPNLFLSEDEYFSQSSNATFNANPENNHNFLDAFEDGLDVIEKNPIIEESILNILGHDYEIIIKKAVCGVPEKWLPQWVKEKIKGVNVANLGVYIRPEFRDITYFRGIDFHQDIIDWPKGKTKNNPATFMTLYVYLHDVSLQDSPLHLLPKSHKLGATVFPHNLSRIQKDIWKYSDGINEIECKDLVLTGRAGYVGLWHNCTLHGTQPVKNEKEDMRLSLRYLLSKKNNNTTKTGINVLNDNIKGNLEPSITRRDLDHKGKAVLKGNIINQD